MIIRCGNRPQRAVALLGFAREQGCQGILYAWRRHDFTYMDLFLCRPCVNVVHTSSRHQRKYVYRYCCRFFPFSYSVVRTTSCGVYASINSLHMATLVMSNRERRTLFPATIHLNRPGLWNLEMIWVTNYKKQLKWGILFRMAPVAHQNEVLGKGWRGGVDRKSKIVAPGIY